MSDAAAQAGRIQALGAGVRIGDQAPDGLRQVGTADDEALGPAGEQHARAARVDGRPRCADPLHGELRIEQRLGGVAGRILDRDAGDPGAQRPGHVGRDALGLDREATFEIGVDRHLDARGDGAKVGQHLVEADRVV